MIQCPVRVAPIDKPLTGKMPGVRLEPPRKRCGVFLQPNQVYIDNNLYQSEFDLFICFV